jgi:fructose-1,6-bisphosphatase II
MATVKAAEAVMPHVGHGDKQAADHAAVCAMRNVLNRRRGFRGKVKIGEGEKDDAPMLYTGEDLGQGPEELAVDIAVDPLEQTSNAAAGLGGAYTVIVAGEPGSIMRWSGAPYMNKLAVGEAAAHLIQRDMININGKPADTYKQVAKALGKDVEKLVVAVLQRDRNQAYIDAARYLHIENLIECSGGDLEQGILTSYGENPKVDLLIGIGGAPETMIQAGFHKALARGAMQAAWYTPDDKTKSNVINSGYDPDDVYSIEDMVGKGRVLAVATGVTSGKFLKGGTLGADGQWQAGETIILPKLQFN